MDSPKHPKRKKPHRNTILTGKNASLAPRAEPIRYTQINTEKLSPATLARALPNALITYLKQRYRFAVERNDGLPTSKAGFVELMGMSPVTLYDYMHDRSKWQRFSVKQLCDWAAYVGCGSLTFLHDPQIHHDNFLTLWQDVIERRKVRGWTQQHMAEASGVALRTLSKYESDIEHAKKNLNLYDMHAIVKALGYAGLTVREVVYSRGQPRAIDIEHDFSRKRIAQEIAQREKPPVNPAMVFALAYPKEHNISTDVVKEIKPERVTANQYGEPILHRTLGDLVRILGIERRARGLTFDRLVAYGVHDNAQTIEAWERGRVLFDGAQAVHDLTLDRLKRWAAALGFGRVFTPALGWDLEIARQVLYHTTRFRGRVLGVTTNAGLFGFKSPKLAKDLTSHKVFGVDSDKARYWDTMPAALYERWAYWAFADGLAFEYARPVTGVDANGVAIDDEQHDVIGDDVDAQTYTEREYIGWTADEAASFAREWREVLNREAQQVLKFGNVKVWKSKNLKRATRTPRKFMLGNEHIKDVQRADAYRPRDQVALSGKIIYNTNPAFDFSAKQHIKESSNG